MTDYYTLTDVMNMFFDLIGAILIKLGDYAGTLVSLAILGIVVVAFKEIVGKTFGLFGKIDMKGG